MSIKPSILYPNDFWRLFLAFAFSALFSAQGMSQKDSITFWEIPDRLHEGRFWTAAGVGAVGYTGAVLTLNNLWYSKYPRTSFHLYDDHREWLQMDKAGHMFTTYFEAEWAYRVARWTGLNRKTSILSGTLVAIGLQATIETLDGFSSEWGFSVSDFSSNILGGALWASQQASWDEQRIRMKVSSTFRNYPHEIVSGTPGGTTTLAHRAEDLFGENIFQTFLKDYNAQTIWLSVNIHSFLREENRFPKWLNVAVGYGAENMYGGFRNDWKEDGNQFTLDETMYPRHRQWYLSPDVDLSKIKTKSRFLHTVLCMANIFKIPAPSLEINGIGEVKWNWFYY